VAVVEAPRAAGRVAARVVDERGRVLVRLEGYETTALPGAVDEAARAPLRAALEPR
jgi:hypothetical protein